MGTKSFKIWTDKILKVPWHSGSIDDVVKKDVSWDAEKTEVNKAELRITARASGRTNLTIYMNDKEIVNLSWQILDDMKQWTVVEGVIGTLINGTNNYTARFWKFLVHPADVTVTFTVELILTYSGKEPDVKPWYEKYVVPVSIGLGTAMVGAVATTEYGRRRD